MTEYSVLKLSVRHGRMIAIKRNGLFSKKEVKYI